MSNESNHYGIITGILVRVVVVLIIYCTGVECGRRDERAKPAALEDFHAE